MSVNWLRSKTTSQTTGDGRPPPGTITLYWVPWRDNAAELLIKWDNVQVDITKRTVNAFVDRKEAMAVRAIVTKYPALFYNPSEVGCEPRVTTEWSEITEAVAQLIL